MNMISKAAKAVLFFAAVSLATLGTWADTWTDPDTGYTWSYSVNGDTAAILGGKKGCPISPSPIGAVTIPSTLGGKPVTSIGSWAFCFCSELTSVAIPDSVTSIGSRVFEGCDKLLYDTSTIPNVRLVDGWAVGYLEGLSGALDLTGVKGVAGGAFYNCSGLTSVMIPDGVTNISDTAFCSCGGLELISVGSGNPCYKTVSGLLLTKDGARLIAVPGGVTSVTIPGSVTSIADSAFGGCVKLTSVTIPDGVTSIGDSAFSGCSGLTSVTIGNGVTNIGYEAFCACSSLASVIIPSSVMTIEESAFDDSCLLTLPARFKGLWWIEDGDRAVFYDIVHVVEFNANGGMSGIASMAWRNDDNAVVGTLPSAWRLGHSFDGWYTARDGGERISSLTPVTGDVTYYAHWIPDDSGIGDGICMCAIKTNDCRYALADHVADRAIASVTVDSDCAIDAFVLKDGVVYDTMLRIVNTADSEVKLTLPTGYSYETFKGVKPLTIPAKSKSLLSITRVEDKTFLVSREDLEDVK